MHKLVPSIATIFCLILASTTLAQSGNQTELEFAYSFISDGVNTSVVTTPDGVYTRSVFASANITGPAINATVWSGGILVGSIMRSSTNQTLEQYETTVFGSSDDGEPFILTKNGLDMGSQGTSARDVWKIGGKYANLRENYVLCFTPAVGMDSSVPVADCYFTM